MKELAFDQDGNLVISPSLSSSQNDFDFFMGKWKIKNRKLKTHLNNCTEWTAFDANQKVYNWMFP